MHRARCLLVSCGCTRFVTVPSNAGGSGTSKGKADHPTGWPARRILRDHALWNLAHILCRRRL